MRILIAGCGDVGGELGRRLHADGHQVWGLRRRSGGLPEGIEPVTADLKRPRTLEWLPPDLDAVVYTASADSRTEASYRAAYLDGFDNLLKALVTLGQTPGQVLFVSSTAVYGQTDGEWVDESSATEPASFSGKILLESEQRALDGPFPATVVRLSGIYGPGRRRLINLVDSGMARLDPESRPVYTNRIHRDDCAGMMHHLLQRRWNGETLDTLYLGVDHEPVPKRQVLSWIAEQLGVGRPTEGSDKGPGRLRGGNKRCRNTRLLATGYQFSYPTFREGYGEMLAESTAGKDTTVD